VQSRGAVGKIFLASVAFLPNSGRFLRCKNLPQSALPGLTFGSVVPVFYYSFLFFNYRLNRQGSIYSTDRTDVRGFADPSSADAHIGELLKDLLEVMSKCRPVRALRPPPPLVVFAVILLLLPALPRCQPYTYEQDGMTCSPSYLVLVNYIMFTSVTQYGCYYIVQCTTRLFIFCLPCCILPCNLLYENGISQTSLPPYDLM
jgi:hypothetical protein